MGFSLPAAIGASFANRDKDIWVIVGDGSMFLTIFVYLNFSPFGSSKVIVAYGVISEV